MILKTTKQRVSQAAYVPYTKNSGPIISKLKFLELEINLKEFTIFFINFKKLYIGVILILNV